MLRGIALFAALTSAPSLFTQNSEPTVRTTADVAQHEAKVTEAAKASPKGFGVETLDDFGRGVCPTAEPISTAIARQRIMPSKIHLPTPWLQSSPDSGCV